MEIFDFYFFLFLFFKLDAYDSGVHGTALLSMKCHQILGRSQNASRSFVLKRINKNK